jgi:hypothetical protein
VVVELFVSKTMRLQKKINRLILYRKPAKRPFSSVNLQRQNYPEDEDLDDGVKAAKAILKSLSDKEFKNDIFEVDIHSRKQINFHGNLLQQFFQYIGILFSKSYNVHIKKTPLNQKK